MTCYQCDLLRERQGEPYQIGKPCDICADTGYDYLGRPCRHSHRKPKRDRHRRRSGRVMGMNEPIASGMSPFVARLIRRVEAAEAERDEAVRRAEAAEANADRWKDAYNTAVISGERDQP